MIYQAAGGALAVGPWDAWNAATGFPANEAVDFSEAVAGNDPGLRNALRHGYWQAMLTLANGPEGAKAIGDLHEHGTQDKIDTAIDLHNNIVGRSIGLEIRRNHGWGVLPHETHRRMVQELVLEALQDGRLIVSDNDPRIKQ